MKSTTMGQVWTDATVENAGDLWNVSLGRLAANKVRKIEIPDVVVVPNSTALALPPQLIKQLGLNKSSEKTSGALAGRRRVAVYHPVRITILGRSCTIDVVEVPNDVPPAVGQIPLLMLDLVVDPRNRRLTGNPAHGGEHVLELL